LLDRRNTESHPPIRSATPARTTSEVVVPKVAPGSDDDASDDSEHVAVMLSSVPLFAFTAYVFSRTVESPTRGTAAEEDLDACLNDLFKGW